MWRGNACPCCPQAIYFLIVMTVFTTMTPAAPDFGAGPMSRFRAITIDRFEETYDVRSVFCLHSLVYIVGWKPG
jgi:hypothetical protein